MLTGAKERRQESVDGFRFLPLFLCHLQTDCKPAHLSCVPGYLSKTCQTEDAKQVERSQGRAGHAAQGSEASVCSPFAPKSRMNREFAASDESWH